MSLSWWVLQAVFILGQLLYGITTGFRSLTYIHTDIMYNVDQQLFSYCTAKFSDNTQCCVPVFDITHELPLCHEHSVKVVSGCCDILSLTLRVIQPPPSCVDCLPLHGVILSVTLSSTDCLAVARPSIYSWKLHMAGLVVRKLPVKDSWPVLLVTQPGFWTSCC